MFQCQTKRSLCVEYSAPVRECVRELRVAPPPQRGGQKVLQLDWNCRPQPDEQNEFFDDFGNRVLRLRHHRIAKSFNLETTLLTEHDGSTSVTRETGLPPNGIGAFLLPSALCDWTPEVQQAAADLTGATPAEICDHVFRHLEYSCGATTLETRASQSIQSRRGVCQDFAHLMIALCRQLKLPARYISGYLPGEGAMHAWCEVLENSVWRAWDPTHNRAAREDYVFVASGRDFRDCKPISGSYSGNAHAQLQAHCNTRLLI